MNDVNLLHAHLCIVEFHEKFQLRPFNDMLDMPLDLIHFREKFLVEEAKETFEAFTRRDKHETLDGLVDLAYVAMGTHFLAGGTKDSVRSHKTCGFEFLDLYRMSTGYVLSPRHNDNQLGKLLDICCGCRKMAIEYGFSFDVAFNRVHNANMKKVRARSDAEGKRNSTWDVVKPEGWTAPDLSDLV